MKVLRHSEGEFYNIHSYKIEDINFKSFSILIRKDKVRIKRSINKFLEHDDLAEMLQTKFIRHLFENMPINVLFFKYVRSQWSIPDHRKYMEEGDYIIPSKLIEIAKLSPDIFFIIDGGYTFRNMGANKPAIYFMTFMINPENYPLTSLINAAYRNERIDSILNELERESV